MNDLDPLGERLPIKVDTTTNGEYLPRPLPHAAALANAEAKDFVGSVAKSLDLSRRNFMVSLTGAAATLIAFNKVHAATGARGGSYELPNEAAYEHAAALKVLHGDEFIFDVQGHHVSPISKWRNKNAPWLELLPNMPRARAAYAAQKPGSFEYLNSIGRDVYVKEIFLDSDTSKAVLTFVPSSEEDMPLSTEEAAITKRIVDSLDGTERLLVHGRVIPTLPGDIKRMKFLRDYWKIAAWKTYTQFGDGWWLDDEKIGVPFLENARDLGVKVICLHKGLPLATLTAPAKFSGCEDIGRAARKYPDLKFIVYHSGFNPDVPEGPFVPGSGKAGIDTLIQSLIDNGIQPNSNVYAELGATWREVMKSPDQQAHVIGKLVKYVGEDNVLWGTDCIWYGSPQDQIQAFRAFQISDEYCDKYGYRKLDSVLKRKIFGLNATIPYGVKPQMFGRVAAGDAIEQARASYAGNRNPSFLTYGPRTPAEFARLHASDG